MDKQKTEYTIAIIGGGPMCTYALERIAVLTTKNKINGILRIVIFERTGHFGAGAVHMDTQPETNYLNRIAGQIAFSADETIVPAQDLLPTCPGFYEWCREKYARTKNEKFNLQPTDIPRRSLHGMALAEIFRKYVSLLTGFASVQVDLYSKEVTDITSNSLAKTQFWVHSSEGPVMADHILFVTGHSQNYPEPGSVREKIMIHERKNRNENYIHFAYPLEKKLSIDRILPGSLIGINGLGLTAIDILLYLTEGRGGKFIPGGNDEHSPLQYIPSGMEPAKIIGFSPSGLLPSCRPFNAKAGRKDFEHKAVFFTKEAIQAIRKISGKPALLSGGYQLQIDFEKHLFPLIVLEMSFLYYKTLFGEKFGHYIRAKMQKNYLHFLQQPGPTFKDGINYLLDPGQACFEQAAAFIFLGLTQNEIPDNSVDFDGNDVIESYLSFLFDRPATNGDRPQTGDSNKSRYYSDAHSPWGHSLSVYDHRFEWNSILNPLSPGKMSNLDDWHGEQKKIIERDILNSMQNNLRNPVKAACDAVWRDLRAELSAAVDHGGLVADSHKKFTSIYLRYYNRLSNGPGIAVMKKVLALIESKLFDLSVGPLPVIHLSGENSVFQVEGTYTGVVKELNAIIEGKTHEFNPELDIYPLYPNLLRKGYIRKWHNPGQNSMPGFTPGGLDLNDRFHPRQGNGSVLTNLTFLGAPANGVKSFQLSLARPSSNSYILRQIAEWGKEVFDDIKNKLPSKYHVSSNG